MSSSILVFLFPFQHVSIITDSERNRSCYSQNSFYKCNFHLKLAFEGPVAFNLHSLSSCFVYNLNTESSCICLHLCICISKLKLTFNEDCLSLTILAGWHEEGMMMTSLKKGLKLKCYFFMLSRDAVCWVTSALYVLSQPWESDGQRFGMAHHRSLYAFRVYRNLHSFFQRSLRSNIYQSYISS